LIIDKFGCYKTNRKYNGRTTCGIWTIPENTEFEVIQIDSIGKQFYSDTFGDWSYWDKDVIKV